MNMAVKTARGQNMPLACDSFGRWADDDIYAILGIRISSLANRVDKPIFQTHISFINAGDINDQRIGDNGIHRPPIACDLGLAHTISNHFATAEFHLIAIASQILFNFNKQFCVRQPYFVACGRAIHIGINFSG